MPLRKATIYQEKSFLYTVIIVISKVEHLRICFDLFTWENGWLFIHSENSGQLVRKKEKIQSDQQ